MLPSMLASSFMSGSGGSSAGAGGGGLSASLGGTSSATSGDITTGATEFGGDMTTGGGLGKTEKRILLGGGIMLGALGILAYAGNKKKGGK